MGFDVRVMLYPSTTAARADSDRAHKKIAVYCVIVAYGVLLFYSIISFVRSFVYFAFEPPVPEYCF